MSNPPSSFLPSLPPLGVTTLLRALFKQPARAASPGLRAAYRLERIDRAHVRRYNAAFGFPGEAVPLTFLYLLAQRAQLAALIDQPIPFRIPGLIHTHNRLAMHGPVDPGTPLVLDTTLSLPPPAANGAASCILETHAFGGERLAFACTSTYLIKRAPPGGGKGASDVLAPAGKAVDSWTVAPDAGRRYAALSGDWNPIHLWSWTARLMGMRAPIIHGMHTVAKACAQRQRAFGQPIATLECQFRAPVPLGAGITMFEDADPEKWIVVCNGRIAVKGQARPA